jgi:preprotein translocase subunit SecD
MLHLEKWKVFLILLTVVLGIAWAAPNALPAAWLAKMPGWLPTKTVNLGLDLRGGSYLLLEAETQAVIGERIQSMVDGARAALRKEDIGYTGLAATGNGVSFTLRDPAKDRDAA